MVPDRAATVPIRWKFSSAIDSRVPLVSTKQGDAAGVRLRRLRGAQPFAPSADGIASFGKVTIVTHGRSGSSCGKWSSRKLMIERIR
jgi:hypothetical protein